MLDKLSNDLLRQIVIRQFHDLGYEVIDAGAEQDGNCPLTRRPNLREVVLVERLRDALRKLNPAAPQDIIERAIGELTRDRSLSSDIRANQDMYQLLKDGIPLPVSSTQQQNQETITVQVIDWRDPARNTFLLVENFWVNGRLGRERLDYVGFVNGLPLILPLIRIGALQDLYNAEVTTYKQHLPRLFWYNAFILVSNGRQSQLGSMTASWEFFFEWKRIYQETDPPDTRVETILQGTCDKTRLLDIVENFTLFSTEKEALAKIIARNHQYLGVNAAYEHLQKRQPAERKLGVFWHTQGAGKSYSMVFFAQKVLHKLSGHWTFVIVTDRDDLDKQIYNTFARVGAVAEKEEYVHAGNREHLKQLLREDHRYLFTLIQKFSTEKRDQQYEELSDRPDIIVMADEAHRTQYDTLARNMRLALPHAAFLGFTGTPLIAGEEHETLDTFGSYVSIYNFTQAIEDKTTVPLYYENHTPQVDLQNPAFHEAMQKLATDASLDEEEEKRLSERVMRENSVIMHGGRLDYVAQDIIDHFIRRGYPGKAMVVSIDKLTAVRTYNRVEDARKQAMETYRQRLSRETDPQRRQQLLDQLQYLGETDMAVVISKSDGDEDRAAELAAKTGEQIDIKIHHQRMVKENLEEKFKKADDALRIAFVCGMWMTGFDVPCLSTIYLDRPLRGHTLMQTLARANRVYDEAKNNGLIIDYVGTYHDLKKALAIYAVPTDRRTEDAPIGEKENLVSELQRAVSELLNFCQQQGLHMSALLKALNNAQDRQQRDTIIVNAIDTLVVRDDVKLQFLALAGDAHRLYQAILPDTAAKDYIAYHNLFRQMAQAIYKAMRCSDITDVIADARQLIDKSLETKPTLLRESPDFPYKKVGTIDLSRVNLAALTTSLSSRQRHLKAEQLRSLLTRKLQQMIQVNKFRVDYLDKLQRIVDKYNETNANFADYPRELVDFTREVQEEEQRHAKEQLSEEELAIYDLLTRPDLGFSENEKLVVKQVARRLLEKLKREQFKAIEWQHNPITKNRVQEDINKLLDGLPNIYDEKLYRQKCEDVFLHVQSFYGSIA